MLIIDFFKMIREIECLRNADVEEEQEPNLQQKVKFYDPHPGLLGCPIPLPYEIKRAAHSLDNKVMTLEEAFNRLEPIAKIYDEGKVKITSRYNFIYFQFKLGTGICVYRLLTYKSIGEQRW